MHHLWYFEYIIKSKIHIWSCGLSKVTFLVQVLKSLCGWSSWFPNFALKVPFSCKMTLLPFLFLFLFLYINLKVKKINKENTPTPPLTPRCLSICLSYEKSQLSLCLVNWRAYFKRLFFTYPLIIEFHPAISRRGIVSNSL